MNQQINHVNRQEHNYIDSNQHHKQEKVQSVHTKERADAAKAFIEKKYAKLKREEQTQKEQWDQLQQKMTELNMTQAQQEMIKKEIVHREAGKQRMKRKKLVANDFEPIKIIGRGAFGEVRLCRQIETNEILAIKKLKKYEMIQKNQVSHIRAERDVLANTNNPWIVDLKCSFQDDNYLYLVMEYLAGGDLMTLLMKRDILTEEEAKFYIAETIIAVDSVHKMNYIHRDLKPDNILIDNTGHLKLSDFGLCKHVDITPQNAELTKINNKQITPIQDKIAKGPKQLFFKRNRKLAFSIVGTPDYIAPEVFAQGGYNETVDWWSVGVILFEMLVGYPPFFSDEPSITCQKILHWRKTLQIPHEANLNPHAIDLIRRLLNDSNERLGINGVDEIKAHPFFTGIDWKRIREQQAPFIPELQSEIDTTNFDYYEEEEPWGNQEVNQNSCEPNTYRKEVQFIGYTFKKEYEQGRSTLVNALEELEQVRQCQQRVSQQQKKLLAGYTQKAQNPNTETSYKKIQNYIPTQDIYCGKMSSPHNRGIPVKEKNDQLIMGNIKSNRQPYIGIENEFMKLNNNEQIVSARGYQQQIKQKKENVKTEPNEPIKNCGYSTNILSTQAALAQVKEVLQQNQGHLYAGALLKDKTYQVHIPNTNPQKYSNLPINNNNNNNNKVLRTLFKHYH